MKTKHLTGTLTLAAALIATPALADRFDKPRHDYRDFAKVTAVTPIYEQVRVSSPRRECWDEEVTTYVDNHRRSATPVILGGIIGGVIGNQIGDGRGRKLATVAGTLLGASIGSDSARAQAAAAQPYTTTAERCRVSEQYYTEERVIGYDVQYRYRGRTYETRMDSHPGERLPVRVTVTPLF